MTKYNIKNILAVFVVVFGMASLIFVHIEDMIKGAIIGYVGTILQYFFFSKNEPKSN
jgi:hypothetical protein